jgi:ABC-type glycerol-3-phosphate transport system substrate-binding protein
MRGAAVVLVAGVVALGACGGDGSPTVATTTTSEASTTVATFGGTPGAAQELACSQSVQTIQQASDLYTATHGAPAPSMDQLPIERPPTNNPGYVITYDAATGRVSATGACTIP